MRETICLLLLILYIAPLHADEGMWMPVLIEKRIADMQSKGARLTAEDIYSINQACLKDAVFRFGGCTGEVVSGDGLILTNHHCAFRWIQSHSTVEHDYLTDGFWAASRQEELPNPGSTAQFLIRMEDVTDRALQGYQSSMTEEERMKLVRKNSDTIIKQETEGTHYEGRVEPFFAGNQYFLFLYEVYKDVRLVGAPPSSIGKYGGDEDNWMWPRHSGDFAFFRIYASKENKPAEYSEENVPYRPKNFLTISTKGVAEGDFTMIYGYPASTNEYLFSDAIRQVEMVNPHKIYLRSLRLNILTEEMEKTAESRIRHAAVYEGISNAWKKWQGELKGLRRLKTVQNKRVFEEKLSDWAYQREEYKGIFQRFIELYAEQEPLALVQAYHSEAVNVSGFTSLTQSIDRILKDSKKTDEKKNDELAEALNKYYKTYSEEVEKKSFIALFDTYNRNIPDSYKPKLYKRWLSEYGSPAGISDFIFSRSILADKSRSIEVVKAGVDSFLLEKDPAFMLGRAFRAYFNDSIRPRYNEISNELALLQRTYMKAQMEFDKKRQFYPDANATLRIAYGKVEGYAPADAVKYLYYSTVEGVMEKDDPAVYDRNVPQALRNIYDAKDFGRWEANGTVPVCFIASNHTSGGNSGSPVFNGKGELIGLNFDRAWEGTMSDLAFDPLMCRNISVDIRYVLFYVDKVAGATYLLDEMKFAE